MVDRTLFTQRSYSYYSKRPFASDPRLSALPKDLFQGATVLDIGCNEGWVTCQIGNNPAFPTPTFALTFPTRKKAQSHGANRVIGVDIDESLISAAWKRRRVVWSAQSPDTTGVQSEKRKRASGSDPPSRSDPIPEYFPESIAVTFGHLPIPPSTRETQDKFPHNLTFRTADWASRSIPEDDAGYDVVLAFVVLNKLRC